MSPQWHFFDHLEDNCGGLHPSELINLPTEMISFYQKTEGIPEYINDLEDAQRKLARAKLPMSNEQLLAIASTAVLAAQHFPSATDEWEALPPAAKTWAAWKTTYRAAHIARKRQLLATGGAEPLSGAHAATDVTSDPYLRLDGYLDNLANAATQEKTTLSQLTDHCTSLSASVASLTAGVARLLPPTHSSQTTTGQQPQHRQQPAYRLDPPQPGRPKNLRPTDTAGHTGTRSASTTAVEPAKQRPLDIWMQPPASTL